MNSKHLHIISFDVPFPPDYGGVIDVYFKIKSLHNEGVKIHLHCFEYGRGEKKELEKYCEKVFYYKRRANKHLLFNSLPYIVASRKSEELVSNLLRDDSPVLFEGLHCCFHLNDERLNKRKKIARMHNIEHNYYRHLALAEKKFFRKKYFEQESKKLEKFEPVLRHADCIAAISPADAAELSGRYRNVNNVMAFHPHPSVTSKEGKGSYALYHGSLSVGENNKAALFLVNEVFNNISIPLIIAGNRMSDELKKAASRNKNIELKEDISVNALYELVQNAQINILPTFQATGIKLKLLAALFTGRHCLVNSPMVENTGLKTLCHVKDSPGEIKEETKRLFNLPFGAEEKNRREKILQENFSNKANVRKLMEILFGSSPPVCYTKGN